MKHRVPSANVKRTKQPQETYVNNSKRDKLKAKMIEKYIAKYGPNADEGIIAREISSFLQKDKLNENDLKNMEYNLEKKLTSKTQSNNLKSTLRREQDKASLNINNNVNTHNKVTHHDKLNDSIHSEMSGGSNLSQFDEHNAQYNKSKAAVNTFIKHRAELDQQYKEHEQEFDFENYPDEWTAINAYSKKQGEYQAQLEKEKTKEIKKRTKEDLDYQVKQKLKKEYETKLKDKEDHLLLLKHLDEIDKKEEIKKQEIKAKMLKEKQSRDVQIKDQTIAKRIEYLKNRKYERELISQINKDIERDKQIAYEKKQLEKAALQKTLKDNELRKEVLKRQREKEIEDDLKIMEDDNKVKEKQEQERVIYFKNIERSANNFMSKMVETVLKEEDIKTQQEQQLRDKYQRMKDEMEEKAERDEKERIRLQKIAMRKYYDQQVKDKMNRKVIEKEMDYAQAEIWKRDEQCYNEQQKEVGRIIRNMNKKNYDTLVQQANMKNNCKVKGNINKMNKNEKAMNKELLRKVARNEY
jgi:hypothetical protein